MSAWLELVSLKSVKGLGLDWMSVIFVLSYSMKFSLNRLEDYRAHTGR
jgi:hypothetical protein